MTNREALAEAKRRYGEWGYVGRLDTKYGIVQWWVGILTDSEEEFRFMDIKGTGVSWESAFEKADQKEEKSDGQK